MWNNHDLLIFLILNIILLLLVATVITEIKPLRTVLKYQVRSVENQLTLGFIFGLLSISSTYTGLVYQGAVVNTRVVSNLAAGLVGGPISGLLAGVMGAVHRYFYDPQGFTSLACALGTFSFGVLGACAYRWLARQRHRNLALVGLLVTAELLQCGFILALCKPFSAAVELEHNILLPKIVFNSLGLVAFMYMLDRLNRSLTIELAEQQSVALYIAQRCLPYLRDGMEHPRSLQMAMDTVRENLPAFKVVMTDRDKVLASSGIDLCGRPLPEPARRAVEAKDTVVVQNYQGEEGVPVRRYSAAIAAPLIWDENVVGILMVIVPLGPHLVLEADIQTTNSLSHLFSSMLELGSLQHQVFLRQQAEFRALQSQINPHFLFNALNTISALCLTDPDKARDTILVLANYFRQTLSINENFVTLEQELSNVNNYLTLTEARFEDSIHVSWDLPEDLHSLHLPPLILQPVVENAVRHGGTAVDDRWVHIQIRQTDQRAFIQVSDRGHGFPQEVLDKLSDPKDPSYTGLFNVRKRLRSIYGDSCEFSIESSQQGSSVSISLPLNPPLEAEAALR